MADGNKDEELLMTVTSGPVVSTLTGQTSAIQAILRLAVVGAAHLHGGEAADRNPVLEREFYELGEM